ncbi:g patch domain and ankyrin repeat-containing protein 1 homolog [Caerostris extrusa]|uniref:G patch domain and ankyrin repeat-containing protein 1 homolog n=1 Tax=Caerostris extrusa TaxID=172846 RepID=A0AAV4XII5_CAEEX|nr:g patch domain and ankyrin repeat-containing protein 1 homolog [Caerostris extrusa]
MSTFNSLSVKLIPFVSPSEEKIEESRGNIEEIKKYVEYGGSIDQQDAHGWTPIMCAACEGHISIVEYLFKLGADLNIRCKYGMTVMDIAMKAKHDAILKLLQDGINYYEMKSNVTTDNKPETIEKFCKNCKTSYTMSQEAHEHSIAHLLVTKKPGDSTFYHIPENNKGFQIMLKSGWDKNKGLGVNADGRKFPIKTILKKDRSCIGKKKEVPKVTHFVAHDETSVTSRKHNPVKMVRERTLKKWERKKLEERNRRWEIKFRQSFNCDF